MARAPKHKDLERYLVRHRDDLFEIFTHVGTKAGLLQFEHGSTDFVSESYAQQLLPAIDHDVSDLLETKKSLPDCVMNSRYFCLKQGAKQGSRIMAVSFGVSAAVPFVTAPLFASQDSVSFAVMAGLTSGTIMSSICGVVGGLVAYREFRTHYGPFYIPETIVLNQTLPADDVVGDIAHELTHHYQNDTPLYHNMLSEGHARGIQLLVTEKWSPENEAIRYDAMDTAAGELKRACLHLRDDLQQDFHGFPFELYKAYTTDDPRYFLSTATMLTAEHLNGKGVYAAALKGDLSFLDA